jgi:acetyltransferase-like isoleucine patch superfamily enzyme
MRAYIVQSDKIIEPFGDYARDCLVRNEPLSELQKRTLLELELEPVCVSGPDEIHDPEPYIIINDNLYFTRELLKEFIERSGTAGECTVCALKAGLVTLRSAVSVQDVKPCFDDYFEYPLYFSPGGRLRKSYRYIKINPDQDSISIPMPEQICGDEKYLVPLTERFIIQVNHWINLWAANISTLLEEGARLQKMPKITAVILALKAHSLNQWKILGRLNKIGQGCDIHPTAYIEASTIGDNVTIGAGAIIRESVIGKGTFVDNGVIIEKSVIAEKNLILDGHIMYSVLYPGTSASTHRVITSLIGKNALIGADVTLTNFRFDGKSVMVIKDGTKTDTGNQFIGCCLGHGVYLGAGCIVAPGRTIPGGLRITLEDTRIIRACHLDQDIPGFRLVKK